MAYDGQYQDDDEKMGALLKNVINPPPEEEASQQAQAQPPVNPRMAVPAGEPPNPVLRTRPAAATPVPATPPPAPTPSSVTPSGTGPTAAGAPQKTLADYVRQSNDQSLQSLSQAQRAADALQSTPSATQANAPLEQRRQALAAPIPYRDPTTGKVMTSAVDPATGQTIDPSQYKPGLGTKILRAVLPKLGPINAPNANYQAAEAVRQGQAGAIEQQEQRNIANEKADTERLKSIGTEQRGVATGYKEVAGAATAQQGAEQKADYNQQLENIKQQLADQSGDKLPSNPTALAMKFATEKDPAKKKMLGQAVQLVRAMAEDRGDAAADRALTREDRRAIDAAGKQKDLAVAKAQTALSKAPTNPDLQQAAQTAFQDAQDAYEAELTRHGQDVEHLTIGDDLTWKDSKGRVVSHGTPQAAQPAAAPAAAPALTQVAPKSALEVQQGQVYNGYKYLGGDRAKQTSWQKVSQ